MADTPELRKFRRSMQRLDVASLKELIERRHPEYDARLAHWDFLEATFEGGRAWFAANIFKYVKEGPKEYADRVERAYRFPHTRETVSLTNKYIFKGAIVRNTENASDAVKDFWKQSTLARRTIADLMAMGSEKSSVFGRPWICVDSNAPADTSTTIHEAKVNGYRVYAYTMRPQDVLDLAYSDDGDLLWIKLREHYRDDADILHSGTTSTRYRLWTPEFWVLFSETPSKTNMGEKDYAYLDSGQHGVGRVPVFPIDHMPSENLYHSPALIEDIAYLDRAVANYLSNLDAIIQDQSFSQLIMPHQALLPGEDGTDKLLELGTKRIMTFDASATVAPSYISPDPKQASMILSVINKIINEIYHSLGMAGERTKEDNSAGIDNSSGVAKAYDFTRLDTMLAAKARSLEIAENTLCEMVDAYHGAKVKPGTYELVKYPESFDVRGLADELNLGMQLSLLAAPDGMRQQQMNIIVDKLFPALGAELVAKLKEEIKQWPPEPVAEPLGTPPSAFAENKQGQNNKQAPTDANKGDDKGPKKTAPEK
jgi:hypothetical protein